ncbi:MAG: hypothetical protein LQ351_000369 [Letrouitia transgressa]|nr:MAG: hypothetical protein LQ351_000369 [Letrouitia transgressa]
MVDVYVPRQPAMAAEYQPDDSGYTMPSSATLPEPPPNPPFVFPMQSTPNAGVGQRASTLCSSDATDGRKTMNRSRPQRLSFNALPNFDFHPSSSSNDSVASDTPPSPTKDLKTSPHGPGHRRNGSEFIGGDGKAGGLGLMSTSPTKGEGVLPPPPGSRSAPPTGRRSHAHRRSGAISSHDLSVVLKPSTETRGGSAPTTPSNPTVEPNFPTAPHQSVPKSEINKPLEISPPSSIHRGSLSFGTPSRTRVGFSDQLEFIPRPLSTISSETSSSLSTVRANHSVTGSISSLLSGDQSSPPSIKVARSPSSSPPKRTELETRPVTAGAVLGRAHHASDPSEDMALIKRPSSASDAVEPHEIEDPDCKSPWTELFKGTHQHVEDRPDLGGYNISVDSNPEESSQNKQRFTPSSSPPLIRPRTSPEPKVCKRQRKVKSWAGSLLARKAKDRGIKQLQMGQKSPTIPSLRSFAPISDFSLEDVNFDEDTTCVISGPPPPLLRPSRLETDMSLRKHQDMSRMTDSDSSSPMIDLDAALESLDTSPLASNFEDVTRGGFSTARRRMHSSGGTGGFSGPGMHYHRRAESAPEMTPTNYHTFGFPRYGSNSAMDDVFEEDEEDCGDEENLKEELRGLSNLTDRKEQSRGFSDDNDGNESTLANHIQQRPRQRSTDLTMSVDTQHDHDLEDEERSRTPTHDAAAGSYESVEIVGADEEPRASVVTKSSDGSTTTPTLTSDTLISRPVSAPLDFAINIPSPAFTIPEHHSSAVSSPDFTKISFDVPRLHTASSSITDRATLSSSRAGEQSGDYRISVDDVPSLTSSASTMLSAHPARFSSAVPVGNSTDLSPSHSTAGPAGNRLGSASKRSSLASLSRLVGSSHGERSKLNIEERVQPDEAEKVEKKKGHRISRLMRFWKSKEKTKSS